jgi:uncharacterized protein Yka (UPF0111/DUF47 family)
MSAIKRMFGRDTRFYDLLECSAAEARRSVGILRELVAALGSPEAERKLEEVGLSRARHRKNREETTRAVCRTFVTPLEREDIEALSSALYKVPKTVEKIAERLLICPARFTSDLVAGQVGLLDRAAEVVTTMVSGLREKRSVEEISESYERLHTLESEADRLMVGLLKDLYQGTVEAKEVVILKDLYELLERAIDRCRDAGHVVFEVVLKYS